MSNIIILSEAAEGHINPFIPIISALIERGHKVVCISGRKFKDKIEATGATFHPLPQSWDPEDQEAYEFFPELKELKGLDQIKFYLKHIMFDQAPETLECLQALLKNFPADVIISDTFMVAGNWITELGGPASIRLSVIPLSLPGKDIAPFGLGLLPGNSFFSKLRNNSVRFIFEKIVFKDVQNHVNKIRDSIGLPYFDKSFFVKGYEVPNLVLHTSTPEFEYARKEYPDNFKFIGPVLVSPSDEFKEPEWWPLIKQDKPVILVTQGTVSKNYDDLIEPAIEALKDKNVIVLLVPFENEGIIDLPENIYTAGYIPFGNLLPYVDVMVTNGGFGGVQNALAHGIPLVIAGTTEDKMEVAARVEYSGAGINFRKQKVSVEDVKLAVDEILLSASFKQKAKILQSNYAQYNAPKLAVKWIEELIENTQAQKV